MANTSAAVPTFIVIRLKANRAKKGWPLRTRAIADFFSQAASATSWMALSKERGVENDAGLKSSTVPTTTRIAHFVGMAVGCCAVQRSHELLLSSAQDVLGKAAEIPERPQKIDSVPAGGGGVNHALISIKCDKNPLREQSILPGRSECSLFSRQFGCQIGGR